MAEVICVGSAVLDHVYDVPALPAGDETIFAHAYRQTGGGAAANAAVAAARLGGDAVLWACLGDDETGDLIVANLVRQGVDTTQLNRTAGAQSPISSVLSSADGSRQTTSFAGNGLVDNTDWLPLGRLQDTGAVLAEPGWPNGAMAVLKAAGDHRLPSVLAIDVVPDTVPDTLLGAARHVVVSPGGLASLIGRSEPAAGLEALRERTGAIVGVTSGIDGFRWIDADGAEHFEPALEADRVDPAGAFDAFCGTFALALGEEKEFATAVRFAGAAAALTAAQPGLRNAFPDRHTVWLTLEAQYGPIDDHGT